MIVEAIFKKNVRGGAAVHCSSLGRCQYGSAALAGAG